MNHKVEDIFIDKIRVIDNVRQRIETEDVSELMASIKQFGLLHAIGVRKTDSKFYDIAFGNRRLDACKKLGWKIIPAKIYPDTLTLKEIIIMNTVENVQRKNVSAGEQGRIFYNLKKDYDMTISELASRFSLSKNRVSLAIHLFQSVPKEFRDKIEFFDTGNKDKKGMIPATLANRLIIMKKALNLSNATINKLFTIAREDEITRQRMNIIALLLKSSESLEDAVEKSNDYHHMHTHYLIHKDEAKRKLEKHGYDFTTHTFTMFCLKILKGEITESFETIGVFGNITTLNDDRAIK